MQKQGKYYYFICSQQLQNCKNMAHNEDPTLNTVLKLHYTGLFSYEEGDYELRSISGLSAMRLVLLLLKPVEPRDSLLLWILQHGTVQPKHH